MSGEDEGVDDMVPAVVKRAFEDESDFIVGRVRTMRAAGESIIQKALTWVPYIDEIFEEQQINVPAACSDVNREERVRIVVGKIEQELKCKLGAATIADIREDIFELYNTMISLD